MKLFLAFILLTVTTLWSQTVYYVDQANGNNSNNGTSLATAWKTIQKACNAATANSVVKIKAGTYYENIVVHVTGTPQNEILFTPYNSDVVIIDGTGTSGTALLTMVDKSHLRFENLIFKNLTVDGAKGIAIWNSANGESVSLSFKNVIIENIKWTDDATTIPGFDDYAAGFEIMGRNGGIKDLTIDGCRISRNVLGYSEAIAMSGNIDGFVISNCEVNDNTNIGIDASGHYGGSDNPETDLPRNGLITGNTCYRNVSLVAQSAGIYIDGGKYITIEKNKCYENGVGIEIGCEEDGTTDHITVKNNLIYKNKNSGLTIGGYTTSTTGQVLNSTVRNNTFFQNSTAGLGKGEITISKASDCVFEDNLIFANNLNVLLVVHNISPQTGNLINYNCWLTPSGNQNTIKIYYGLQSFHNFMTYRTNTLQDENSIFVTQGFDATILPVPLVSSPTTGSWINAGNPVLNVNSSETDYDGNPRIIGGRVDMGARESNVTLATTYHELDINSYVAVPNPFSTQTIVGNDAELVDADFELYDAFGRKVITIKHITGNEIVVDRGNLPIGLYLFRIIQENKIVATGKLITE